MKAADAGCRRRSAASMVSCRNELDPWWLPASPGVASTSPPLRVIRLRPVAASNSSQISFERNTSGTNSRPSPMAWRVMRVSPCDEPWS